MKSKRIPIAVLTMVMVSSAFLVNTASAAWNLPNYPVNITVGAGQLPVVVTLSGIVGSYDVTNGPYTGYCIELGVPVVNPNTAVLLCTDGAGSPWNEINWLLNNYPDSLDVQFAIWRLRGISEETFELRGWTYTAAAKSMYNAALAHSSFIPSAGDKVGVRCLISDAQDQLIYLEPTLPTGSITINDGAATTSVPFVALTLAATGDSGAVAQMRFSNLGESWTAWEQYTTSKAWLLTSGAGTKTVYVQFKDGSGVESIPYSDTILFTPLVDEQTFDVPLEGSVYVITTRSNSSISEFSFNQVLRRIRLGVEGAAGTAGFCNITIPAAFMSGNFSVFVDGVLLVGNVGYVQAYNGTHYTISINYTQSAHTVEIVSTSVIPEFPSSLLMLMILPLFSGTLLLRKKLLRTRN